MRHIVKYSQNFLDNAVIARRIVSLADNFPGHYIVEVGPGKGALTSIIAERGKPFTAVEIDEEMVRRLRAKQQLEKLCGIIHSDFMDADLSKLPPEGGQKILFIGNLPYACGAAIMRKALEHPAFGGAVFMLQKEVADRIVAKPGGGDYGLLTLSAQSKAKARIAMNVGRSNFKPVPKVNSSVVELVKLDRPLFENADREKIFFATAKAAFAHRRKTIINSLSISLCISKQDIEPLLESVAIAPQARAETVPLDNYLRLSAALAESKFLFK